MSLLRKIVDEKDARACLLSVGRSGETLRAWAKRPSASWLGEGGIGQSRIPRIDRYPARRRRTMARKR
jgi:hypothetical protein